MGQMISRSNAETLIDEQVSREIIEGAIKQSKAMTMFRRLPNMTSNKTKMRVLDSLPLVYWQGSDNARKKLTKMAWDKKYITAEEMAVIVPIPENVLDDADYDIWAEVKPRIEEAMGKKFDQAVFTGDDKPAGFRADLLTSALNAGATVSPLSTLYLSIDKAMSYVEESGYNVSGVLGGMNVKSAFRTMLDNNGQPIKGTEIDSLAKAYVDNGAWDKSKAQMLVGDFNQAVYSIRQDITFKVLDQAVIQDPSSGEILYNLAQDDMVALRVTMRLGWEIPNPINSLQPDEAVRFPFAVILPATYTENRVDVEFTVKDTSATVIEGAKVNFNGLVKKTDTTGKATFKSEKNSSGLYRVTHEDMKRDVLGQVDAGDSKASVSVSLALNTVSATEKYTITYDANGGTGSINAVEVEKGKSVTLSDGTGLTAPTGKTFKGWAKTNSAQNPSVTSPFTPTADITLYAIYGE